MNLSYLQPSEQGLLAVLMTGGEIKKIDLKSSAQLKELSTQNNFSKETVLAVFAPKQKQIENKKITFAALADYFDADIREEQALEYIRKALEYYRGNGGV